MPVVIPDAFWPRIVAAVRAVEAQQGGPPAVRRCGASAAAGGVWGEITGASGSGHTWKQVRPGAAGDWEDVTGGLGGGSSDSLAYEASGRTGVPAGTVVRLGWYPTEGGAGRWLFSLGFTPDGEPAEVGSDDEDENPASDSWDVTSQGGVGVTLTKLYRVAYDHEGDKTVYAFYRDETYDGAGNLVSVSAETRVAVDVTEEY